MDPSLSSDSYSLLLSLKKSNQCPKCHVAVLILHTIVLMILCRRHPAQHLAERDSQSFQKIGPARARQMFGVVSGCGQGLCKKTIETAGQASPK